MLYNDPKTFREDMLKGYAAAFPDYIVEVPGGVARATETPEGKVAVINGGGSGHYPAFCGVVGSGFMDAAVVGNVFTSPSTDDVYHVAKAVENGNGVFIIGCNYAGDKMNFNLARDRLIEEGIDARSFFITFTVFKVAGAASAAGCPFDEIVRLTPRANDSTRTMSVGLKGCTMPGASEPLFKVPDGKMEVGQGIHGEPGVYESDLASASELGELLISKILEDVPEYKSRRIAVILDGFGSTKYEELFVVWKTVSEVLKGKGYTLVDPQVGELVTSLDMEGIVVDELLKMKNQIIASEEELARIDSVAGDGDHGRGMVKGVTHAYEAAADTAEGGAGVGSVLCAAGRAWAAKAAADRMQELGNAKRGDKTMLDTLIPFAEKLENAAEEGLSIREAWTKGAETAEEAARATAELLPKVGRARPQAKRSCGTPDA